MSALLCWIIDTPTKNIFPVEIGHDKMWGNVKDAIKVKKEPEFDDIAADTLDLWKVTISRPQLRFLLGSKDYLRSVTDTDPLNPIDFVSTEFKELHPHDCVDIIIVQRPFTISPSTSSFKIEASPSWCPRSQTVRQLYGILLQEKFVHVRGTPGCGKSTLMTLLHAYILEQLPLAFVRSVHSWRPIESDLVFEQRLREIDPEFPRQRQPDPAFILFDDGQDSYRDLLLWNSFIKEVCEGIYPRYRIILFCSYGSPSSRPLEYTIGTPPTLSETARISLLPGKSPIGLLLNWPEYMDVVSRFERLPNLHSELLVLIFHLTAGHVGAIVGLLHMISYLVSPESLNSAHQKAGVRRGQQFTVKDYYDEIPLHVLVRSIDRGAFGRGLPQDSELSVQPDVVALFRTLLKDRKLERRGKATESKILRKCHHRGWILATAIQDGVRYTLPSPLHEACLSWKLEPTNMRPFTSLFELSLATISKFRPSQLRTPRRVASETTDPPEAQYQDEFYNSLLFVTSGNVRISPEYASAMGAGRAGRIDYFIPIVKWGIEIIRDGDRLLEHAARFTDSGAYGAWLKSQDIKDYILLDCRSGIPRDPHPKIRNLYHVVFQNDCREVVVYDNCLRVVKGPIVLQENHL